MKQRDYIILLDPSLQNNKGEPSDNLGDQIIYDSIKTILEELFSGKEIIRISTHVDFTKKEKNIIKGSRFIFVGGTNILTSDIRNFPRLTPIKKKGFYLFPGIKNLILLGTGWTSYQSRMDWATKFYYKRILSNHILHSVRDIYSLNQLNKSGFENIIHTSCPSAWHLDTSFINRYDPSFKKILFTLTSYYPDETADNLLLETILNAAVEETCFFPQSKSDTEYLMTLPIFKKNISKFTLLNHDLAEFYNLVSSKKINYIGNRLHSGIKCLTLNQPSMILSVDNRASEIGKSINLNVVARGNLSLLQKWICNEYIPPSINLPFDNIEKWKTQFVKK